MINMITRQKDYQFKKSLITPEIIPSRSLNQNQTFKASVSAVSNSSQKSFITMVEHIIPAVELAKLKSKYDYLTDKNNNYDNWHVFFEN